jgi:hypothetical protein
MLYKRLSLCAAFMLGIGLSVLLSQEAIPASGGMATGTGGTVSYTVGQVAYTTVISSSGTVTQGVQQPYEIHVVTELEEARGISLEFSVYPNPTSDMLKLMVVNYAANNLTYELYDIQGNLLRKMIITGDETIIEVGNLAPAAYFLKITDDQTELKTFKIIKIK